MEVTIESLTKLITLVGVGLAIIFTVWRMTRDVRSNFGTKVSISTCKIISKGINDKVDSLKDHIDTRFDDLKSIIKPAE